MCVKIGTVGALVPTLLVNDKKLKDPTEVANTLNNSFITSIEKLNIQ